ncbi:MAG: TIGR04165 family Cys-rich peptide [Methanobrevibacter sp.]|jgi:Cys-rich peptide (TIGR04165 family)|nr:TIGR04165 family Cys-rich peptide [Candidatus Methanovirga basalitermitum]
MRLEQLLEKCPKCGTTDKTAKKKFLDEHKAYTKLKSISCDKCGHVFEEK